MEQDQRKWLPSLGELLDRLTINSIKEIKITNRRAEYAQEISDILHDIDLILSENDVKLDAELIRNIVILSQYNLHIWVNEANYRNGIKDGNNLELTHGLNSIRCNARNRVQECVGGRKDYKLDNVEAFPEWIPSGYEES